MRHITHPRKAFWFGTKEFSQWLPTPLAGADMSSLGSEVGGTYLDGGGYQVNAWDTHKTYSFEWPSSTSPEVAQTLKSYRDGTYGRGLIYFLDPLTFDKNILPARFADPSMALGNEAPSLVAGVTPVEMPTSNWVAKRLPARSVMYDVASAPPATIGNGTALWIPVPEGHTLYLGAHYSYGGNGGVFYHPVDASGTPGTGVRLTPKTSASRSRVGVAIPRPAGGFVVLRVGTSSGAGTVILSAMTALLAPDGYISTAGLDANLEPTGANYPNPRAEKFLSGNWIGGMGNSGCRFSGTPTYSVNSGINGGRVSVAATFREVGSWIDGSETSSISPTTNVFYSQTEPNPVNQNLFDDPLPLSIASAPPANYSRWFGQGGTAAAVALADGWIRISPGGADSTGVRSNDWAANGKAVLPNTEYTVSVDMETGSGLQDMQLRWWATSSAGVAIGAQRTVNPTRVGSRVYYRFTTPEDTGFVTLVLARMPSSAWVSGDLYRIRNTQWNAGSNFEFRPRFNVGDLWYVLNASGAITERRRWQGNSWVVG